MQRREITPEYRGRDTYLTFECPECGEQVDVSIPSSPLDTVGTALCDDWGEADGCGAEYEFLPVRVDDHDPVLSIEENLSRVEVDPEELIEELETGGGGR